MNAQFCRAQPVAVHDLGRVPAPGERAVQPFNGL